ncbi:MAG: hypothetical protein HC799_18195 [Limnothrix sp. RL_2_0]|nr:hypothetical protein [Limnothrix sp. RL_2_0]
MTLWDVNKVGLQENLEVWGSVQMEELHAQAVINAEGDVVSYADLRDFAD